MNSNIQIINEKTIEEYLDTISFPRLSGTQYEQRAADIIIEKIKEFGLIPKIQNFSYSSFYSRIYKKIAFSLIFWLVLVLFINLNSLFTILNVVFIISIFIPLIIYTRKPEKIRLGKIYHSKNVYLKLNASKNSGERAEENQGNTKRKNLQLLFVSHIDSKSQTLPIKLRVITLRSWIYSIIFISILLIIKYIFLNNLVIDIILIVLLGINFVFTIMVILNITRNESNGAIDNGSGVCMVLELLKYYSQASNRPKNVDLWFVFTGAEETGTMGIRFFKKILEKYEKEKVVFFNLDAIAQNLDIFGSTRLEKNDNGFFTLLFDLSKSLDARIIIKKYITAITRSDGYFLKKQGFNGLDFGDKKSYEHIHSVHDTVDKVNPTLLANICILFIKFLNKV
ncbi:MAG: M20/M25/M40 family metallo-hydrolase [Promethearchaeota archaeon]|nr:MAG: M20/M25/M40 family metallo-hydrolase [Candidatus Lokiarchaeota archaeon]